MLLLYSQDNITNHYFFSFINLYFVNLQKIWLLENGFSFKWNKWIYRNYCDIFFHLNYYNWYKPLCLLNIFTDVFFSFLFSFLFYFIFFETSALWNYVDYSTLDSSVKIASQKLKISRNNIRTVAWWFLMSHFQIFPSEIHGKY